MMQHDGGGPRDILAAHHEGKMSQEEMRALLATPEECKRHVEVIGDQLNSRILESQNTTEVLEEHLATIREQVHRQMLLLKDLELEKIDRSMHYQKVANAYQNWRQQYLLHRLSGGVPERIESALIEEQQFLRSELESHVGLIIACSNNVHRLREMKDVIERKIAQKKKHLASDTEFLMIRNQFASDGVLARQMKELYGR